MKPEYVAKKTMWGAITFWRIILCWLIIPLIVMIVQLIQLKYETIEFYEDRIVVKSGVLSKREKNVAFVGVRSVSVNQSLWGRIFKYGDVQVDTVGKWDVNTKGVKNPRPLVEYLETKIISKKDVHIFENQ